MSAPIRISSLPGHDVPLDEMWLRLAKIELIGNLVVLQAFVCDVKWDKGVADSLYTLLYNYLTLIHLRKQQCHVIAKGWPPLDLTVYLAFLCFNFLSFLGWHIHQYKYICNEIMWALPIYRSGSSFILECLLSLFLFLTCVYIHITFKGCKTEGNVSRQSAQLQIQIWRVELSKY